MTTLPAPTMAFSPTTTFARIVDPEPIEAPFLGHRTGIAVVDECHAMADENAILNIDTFTDKRVTGDFAILSNSGVFLNFDEGANLCVIADFTAVEVDKF